MEFHSRICDILGVTRQAKADRNKEKQAGAARRRQGQAGAARLAAATSPWWLSVLAAALPVTLQARLSSDTL